MDREMLSAWREKGLTISFVAANILLFLVSVLSGDLLYGEGAFSLRYLFSDGGWQRFLTSMFLHADAQHLGGNMLMLYMAGELVEQYMGNLRFAALYFFSGISGSLLYAAYEHATGRYADTIGASGAVFGVIGALIVIVARHRGRYAGISFGRIGLMAAYMIYMGFRTPNVNNAAHIGGLLGGMALAALMRRHAHRLRVEW